MAGNTPVSGATVKLGFRTTLTNIDGSYQMDSAVLDKNVTVVTVEKEGFMTGIRTFSATSGINEVNIKIFSKILSGEFETNVGGTVELPNFCKVEFSPNTIEKESGGSYTGLVRAYLVYLDPTKPYMPDYIPGSYLADDKNNNRVTLVSYGMIGVELESPTGEQLQLIKRKTATITSAIPASLQSSAPATISLWHMDESTGLWKEEGTATKVGSNYVGTVSHFSFWNFDVPTPVVNLNAVIKDQNGNPLAFRQLRLNAPNLGFGFATTDQNGEISGAIPAGAIISIEIYFATCSYYFPLTTIGPFTSNTNLGTITVNVPEDKLVTGRVVNCSGNAVTNGFVIINYGQRIYSSIVNSNGEFSLTITACNATDTACQIIAVDNNAQLQSSSITVRLPNATINIGNISACGNTPTTQFMTYSFDNRPPVTFTEAWSFSRIEGTKNVGDTSITVIMTDSGAGPGLFINFKDNNSINGPSPLVYVHFNESFTQHVPAQPINVMLTSYASQVGEFYSGSFSGDIVDVRDINGVRHPFTCSFRLRRTR